MLTGALLCRHCLQICPQSAADPSGKPGCGEGIPAEKACSVVTSIAPAHMRLLKYKTIRAGTGSLMRLGFGCETSEGAAFIDDRIKEKSLRNIRWTTSLPPLLAKHPAETCD